MMFNQPLLNLVIMQGILSSGIREDIEPKDWVTLITVLNIKGMLYYGFQDGKLARIVIAYRVKEINENTDLKNSKCWCITCCICNRYSFNNTDDSCVWRINAYIICVCRPSLPKLFRLYAH